MAKDQGTKVRKKKFTKLYYLLLVPAIAAGLLVTSLVTSANHTAVEIVSFPDFTSYSQAEPAEGSEAAAANYLPLATTEVNVGEDLDISALPGTVNAELLKEIKGEDGETELATESAIISVDWDWSALDVQKPGEYMLSMIVPEDYVYNGKDLPYVMVEVKEAEGSEEAEATEQLEAEKAEEQPAEQEELAGVPCSHNEGCQVACEDEADCQHICDLECGGVSNPEIVSFSGIYPGTVVVKYELQKGEQFNAQSSVFAFLKDGSIAQVPIEWEGNVDTNSAGTYTISMKIDGGYVWNGASLDGEVVVIESENGR